MKISNNLQYYKRGYSISKFQKILFLLMMFFVASLFAADETTFVNRLENDVAVGKITRGQSIAYQLMAIRDPNALPQKYRTSAPDFTRSGTALLIEARRVWPTLTTGEQKLLAPYFERPSKEKLPESEISPKGLFKIHYAANGNDAADPSFVRQIAETFDHVYDVEINQLGYQPPPSDFGVDGPEYDVYVHNISDYGYTNYDQPVPGTPWQDYTSFIEMDNDFTHTPTKGLDGMHVTAAHEFFHMIQIGYRSYQTPVLNSVFLYESCSVWMEDVVYNNVNDYYNYLPYFFSHLSAPFNESSGTHMYGLSIFNHMLEQKYGRNVIRRIWEEFRDHETYQAIDNALVAYGSNLSNELADFSIWNIFTGVHADTVNFYNEGKYYPDAKANKTSEFTNTLTLSGNCQPLATNYQKIMPTASGDFVVRPTFEEPFDWIYSIVIFPFEGTGEYTMSGGNSLKSLKNVRSLSEIWVLPTLSKWPQSDYGEKNKSFQFFVERGNAPQMDNQILSVVPNPYKPLYHSDVEIRFRLAKQSQDIKLNILTERGKKVKGIEIGKRPDGDNKAVWDGRNESGDLVTSGIYLFYLDDDGTLIGPGKIAVIH